MITFFREEGGQTSIEEARDLLSGRARSTPAMKHLWG